MVNLEEFITLMFHVDQQQRISMNNNQQDQTHQVNQQHLQLSQYDHGYFLTSTVKML